MGDVAHRRIRLSSILTGCGAAVVLAWSGFSLHFSRDLVARLKVPVSHVYAWLVSVPLILWHGTALALGILMCLKDLWVEEQRARVINTLALPFLFLVYLFVDIVARSPYYTLLEGVGSGSR